jgi:hypothetical protein
MPKRISKPVKKNKTRKNSSQKDSNQIAFATIQRTIEASEAEGPELDRSTISAVMSALGRKGGKIGGKRRLKTMTAEERSQAALKAARARWRKATETAD